MPPHSGPDVGTDAPRTDRSSAQARQSKHPTVRSGRWRRRRAGLVLAAAAALVAGGAGVQRDSQPPRPEVQPSPPSVAQPAAPHDRGGRLTNGCRYSERGIPSCGALLGAAYGSNTGVLDWEAELGHRLGVHRTYYAQDGVSQAVEQARADLSYGRMPWVSFKLPYSWRDMAAGKGDAWARDLAKRLSKLDGPVWLAFHHEPENDGPMNEWTRMQQHLAPLVRREAPNVAYTIILTGWNQVYGPSWLSLDAIWPTGSPIDLVGFDVYNDYGVLRSDGTLDTTPTDLGNEFFVHFQDFSQRYGVPWAIAETGITDEFAQSHPQWIRETYRQLVQHGGLALSYFNSHLNSTASWRMDAVKEHDFAKALSGSPTLEPVEPQAP
jgi:hypothetical protein